MNKDKKPLSITHPEIAKEAHGWDPATYNAKSHERLKWRCSKGHLWESLLYSRKNHRGCPYCLNKKVLVGFNDLSTTHPEISQEAHGWDPHDYVAKSGKIQSWKCYEGHIWRSRIADRTSGRGCPICKNKKLLKGFNDLATTHPEIASEAHGWDPTEFIAGSMKQKSWKCSRKHIWQSSINNRTQGYNCPFCGNRKLLKGFNDLATTHPEIASEAHGWDPTTLMSGSHKKVQWKCTLNHTWISTVLNRLYGSGCPTCTKFGFDPNLDGYLYFLMQPNWELYQVGITNNLQKRLRDHKKNNFEVLEIRGPMEGRKARELETAILRYLKSQKANLSPDSVAGKFDGYTESWTIDSFKVNNLKELIDKASEAGY